MNSATDNYTYRFSTRINDYLYDASANRLFLINPQSTNPLHSQPCINQTASFSSPELDMHKYQSCMSHLVIQITQRCNLSCEYCPYAQSGHLFRTHSSKTITLELAKKGIDFIGQHSADDNHIALAFYGGEPLLEYALLKRIVAYSHIALVDKEVTYSMTTNGTLLNEEIILFLAEHNFALTISLDGDKDRNDRYRKFSNSSHSVFDTVTAKISLIKKIAHNLYNSLSFSVVTDQGQSIQPVDAYFSQHYPSHVCRLSAISPDGLDNDFGYSNKYIRDLLYSEFISKLSIIKGDIDSLSHFDKQTKNALSLAISRLFPYPPINENTRSAGMCEIGIHKLFMDVDGNFFPCEKINERNCSNIIGNVTDGLNFDSIRKCIDKETILPYCYGCFAYRLCQMCLAHYSSHNKSDEVSLAKANYCKSVRTNIAKNLKWIATYQEIIHQICFLGSKHTLLSVVYKDPVFYSSKFHYLYEFLFSQGLLNKIVVASEDEASFFSLSSEPIKNLQISFSKIMAEKKSFFLSFPHFDFLTKTFIYLSGDDYGITQATSSAYDKSKSEILNLVKGLSLVNLPYAPIAKKVLLIYGLYRSPEKYNFIFSLLHSLCNRSVNYQFWSSDLLLASLNHYLPIEEAISLNSPSKCIKILNYIFNASISQTNPDLVIIDIPDSFIKHNNIFTENFSVSSFIIKQLLGNESVAILRLPHNFCTPPFINSVRNYLVNSFSSKTIAIHHEPILPIVNSRFDPPTYLFKKDSSPISESESSILNGNLIRGDNANKLLNMIMDIIQQEGTIQ